MSKIHVTLSDSKRLLKDKAKLEDVAKKIVEVGNIRDVNEKRLYKYGVLSGNIANESVVEQLEELGEVKSVSVDELRHASS